MSRRVDLVSGDAPLSSLVGSMGPLDAEHVAAIELVAPMAAAALANRSYHVQRGFLCGDALCAARLAAERADQEPLAPGLLYVVAIVHELRLRLAEFSGRDDLLDSAELQCLTYRPGGSYRRHVDNSTGLTVGSSGRPVQRSVSFLVYLTPDDWDPTTDGGALRIHAHADQPTAVDVQALPGTLVIFDSSRVPHEVLQTQRTRLVLVGWLQELRAAQPAGGAAYP
jgi:hypothetical protein